MDDSLETAFEIRAGRYHPSIASTLPPDVYRLTLEHKCEKKPVIVQMDLAWVLCPWCSKQVPKRIRRVFSQGSSDAGA